MFNDYSALLTVEEVCNLLQVERHAIYQLINSGELEAIKANQKDWRIVKESLIFYTLKSSGIDLDKEDIYDYI